MSSFHGGTVGLLSAATTFGVATVGVTLVPKLSESVYFRVIAYASYTVLALLLLSFVARQVMVKKHRKP